MKSSRFLFLAVLMAGLLLVAYSPAAAKDEWIQIKSKNFLLIGNASEKDIRKVGTRLEQFRETFRLLFGQMNLTSPIPTNVIVFKSDSYYKNFKPKRADGKIDNFVAGYFQSGEDVNYITLSTEGEDSQTYSTIFHEYVHFIVNTNFGKSEVPAWFNEGLAEYYESFAIEADQTVKLGLPQGRHLEMLQQNKLVPLDTLFRISNAQLLQTGGHSRSVFYAESWALIHYLIQGGKTGALGSFLDFLLKDTPPEKAFQDAFQITYAQMESELKKYVSKSSYQYQQITLAKKLVFDAEMQALPLGEAASNAYLGDLLFHTDRVDDAEPYLLSALKLQPDSSVANTTLGMVKLKQRKFDEAKKYLESAISGDQKNHIALFRYAFLLSREAQDDFGYVRGFDKETANKMRDALNKAIAVNPAFTESYELLAYVNLVSSEQLDESIALLKSALKYQPGNQRYTLRIAEILLRQSKLAEAELIAQKIASTTDDPATKSRADALLNAVNRMKQYNEQQIADRKAYEAKATDVNRDGDTFATDDPHVNIRSINGALRKLPAGEKRVIGSIQKIDCKTRPLVYTIKTPTETFTVSSNDFESLTLNAFTPEANKAQIGCDENLAAMNAVITYRPKIIPRSTVRGELVAVEFVQNDFRFLDQLAPPRLAKRTVTETPTTTVAGTLTEPPPLRSAEAEAQRRAAMMQAINLTLKKPAEGQKREMGYLDKIECTSKGVFFHIRTVARTFRLLNSSPESLKIGVFTPDLTDMQIGCGIKPIEIPAVFVYTDKPDAKAKTDGEIISLEFVPKSFVLDQ